LKEIYGPVMGQKSLEDQNKPQTEGIISNFPYGGKYYTEKFEVAGGM
jgi:hypothetical protein